MKEYTRIEPTERFVVGGKFKREVVVKHFRTDDGLEHEFTTIFAEGHHAGGVIALTPRGEVITSYQFRPGPEEWYYDIPGGAIEDGEDPKVGSLRELQEETGYTSDDVKLLGTSSRDGYINVKWHYYLALDCYLSESGRTPEQTELDQGAEVRLISIKEFIEHAKNDEMCDPHAVLMAYEKLKEVEAKQ